MAQGKQDTGAAPGPANGQAHRYLFLCPDGRGASGGIAVLYDMVAELRNQGYDAVVLHGHRSARYPDGRSDVPIFTNYAIRREVVKRRGLRYRIGDLMNRLLDSSRGGTQVLHPEISDVIVVPEFLLAEALAAFPRNPKVLISQNPFSHLRSHARALRQNINSAQGLIYSVGIADICLGIFDLLENQPVGYVPVTMWPERFPYQQEKEKLITFMPRKRREEASVIEAALRSRSKLRGYRLESIDGVPHAEVAKLMAKSRIFISLLSREALGFPAAEAMAAGCIVVGYTGLGTREYFDDTTGIPVPEGDTAAVVRAVEEAVDEYETTPGRLDEMRLRASETVNRRYSREAFLSNLIRVWKEVEMAVPAAVPDHGSSTR